MSQQNGNDTWTYPTLEEVMAEAVIQDMETYVALRYNTIPQFIVTRPIMGLCLEEVWRPGERVSNRWWEEE